MKPISILLAVALWLASQAQSQSQQPSQPAPVTRPATSNDRPFFNPNKFNFDTNSPAANPNAVNPAVPPGTRLPATSRTNQPVAINFSITNTLSAMSPVQVNNVMQVQVGLNGLQNTLVSLGVSQNVQVVLQHPQVQQQVQQVATRISTLAVGPTRPSQELVLRLSRDLTSAFAPARLPPERLLILSVVINQTVNCQSLTAVQVEEAINSGVTVLQASGAPMSVAHLTSCDLHAIALEVNPSLGM